MQPCCSLHGRSGPSGSDTARRRSAVSHLQRKHGSNVRDRRGSATRVKVSIKTWRTTSRWLDCGSGDRTSLLAAHHKYPRATGISGCQRCFVY